ncbi:MAG: GNAT family N-acetyltransferase [Bacilli bacterium]|nr:GNAT family N-acetyltransferase [Bacilli bacterium]
MKIREKKYEDIRETVLLGNIFWDETYRGIVDDEFLDNMPNTVEERVLKQQTKYKNDEYKDIYNFVMEDNGKIIGVTSSEKSRDEDYPNSGEVGSLYLLKEYQGKGLGKELLNYAVNKLKELGYNDYIIGCLDGNPTNEFYKHMGGKLYKKVYRKIGDKDYLENYYHFEMR